MVYGSGEEEKPPFGLSKVEAHFSGGIGQVQGLGRMGAFCKARDLSPITLHHGFFLFAAPAFDLLLGC
jgi:hypothetical protein